MVNLAACAPASVSCAFNCMHTVNAVALVVQTLEGRRSTERHQQQQRMLRSCRAAKCFRAISALHQALESHKTVRTWPRD